VVAGKNIRNDRLVRVTNVWGTIGVVDGGCDEEII
jgi:hypothetical protein